MCFFLFCALKKKLFSFFFCTITRVKWDELRNMNRMMMQNRKQMIWRNDKGEKFVIRYSNPCALWPLLLVTHSILYHELWCMINHLTDFGAFCFHLLLNLCQIFLWQIGMKARNDDKFVITKIIFDYSALKRNFPVD